MHDEEPHDMRHNADGVQTNAHDDAKNHKLEFLVDQLTLFLI